MEHGNCPQCGIDLNGQLIWEYFHDLTGSETEADDMARCYGASREQGRWGKAIALYCWDTDRTVSFRCPNCDYVWARSET